MATVYEQRQYTESDAAKKLREQMEKTQQLMPGEYQGKYQGQIDQTIGSIMDRKPFSYDVNGDALWHQYKDRYTDMGRQAMMDTMGQAAQLTGGYGNSYAQMAGQQAYQNYLKGATDMIPQLAQMAQQRYNQQGQEMYQLYGLLSGEEQRGYGNWADAYNRWRAERDYTTGRYDTERGFDYGTHRDSVTDDQWKAQFDEDVRRFDFANKLGEFAPAASAGGGGGWYGGDDNPNPGPPDYWAAGIDTTRNQNGLKGSSWDYTKHNLTQLVNTGNSAAAEKYMDQVAGQMNESQFKQAMAIIQKK